MQNTTREIIEKLGSDRELAEEWSGSNEQFLCAAYALESKELRATDENVELLETLWESTAS